MEGNSDLGEVFIGLVHYPVLNKNGVVVATSVTNLDIHDIARAAKTYGVSKFFIINPMQTQKKLVKRIVEYWCEGGGKSYNHLRGMALENVDVVDDLTSAKDEIIAITGVEPEIVGTWARYDGGIITIGELRNKLDNEKTPFLILFGTGWGMTDSIKKMCTYIIEPIRGTGEYHHLSVRSAVAIILDRIRGRNEVNRLIGDTNVAD